MAKSKQRFTNRSGAKKWIWERFGPALAPNRGQSSSHLGLALRQARDRRRWPADSTDVPQLSVWLILTSCSHGYKRQICWHFYFQPPGLGKHSLQIAHMSSGWAGEACEAGRSWGPEDGGRGWRRSWPACPPPKSTAWPWEEVKLL